ncbi:MAG: hypothetical protein J7K88_00810 [Candidatus Fermentibacteraceae bacterium]|nr:hypothetical protein [Candidatus Fermentibacteraceae bacterium]
MQGSENAVRNYVHKLKFQVRDTLLAARYGLNARSIWVFWKGMVLAWLVWAFFVYAGFLAAGDSVTERFRSAVLCPLPDSLFMSSVPSVILLVAGTLLAFYIYMLTALKVSRLTFEQLRGDQFFSDTDARRFCRSNWKPVVATPLVIALGIVFGLALIALAGVVGSIPAAGPVIAGLLAVPLWVLGLFLILAFAVLVLSVFLVPVITASTKGDTFECLFEVFSVVTSQPMRLFRGFVTGLSARVAALAVFSLFAWGSVSVVSSVVYRTAGIQGLGDAMESGFSRVAPEVVPFYSSIFNPLSSTEHTSSSWSGTAELVVSLSGAAILLVLWAYWLSSCTAQWTIMYLGLRFNRDREDLLLRADEEEYREFRKIHSNASRDGGRKEE